MADEKKDKKDAAAPAEAKSVTLLNRGKRHFDLPGGRVSPNETVACTADDAAKLTKMYPRELLDISKLPVRGTNAEAEKLKKDNAALADENAKLKEQLAASAEPKGKDKK